MVILTDPALIEQQEQRALLLAMDLGGALARLPEISLAVTRQIVADKMVEEFCRVRGPIDVKAGPEPHPVLMYDYLN